MATAFTSLLLYQGAFTAAGMPLGFSYFLVVSLAVGFTWARAGVRLLMVSEAAAK